MNAQNTLTPSAEHARLEAPRLSHSSPIRTWPSLGHAGLAWKWTALAWPLVLAVALGSFAAGQQPLRVVLLLLALPVVEELVLRLGAQERLYLHPLAPIQAILLASALACALNFAIGGVAWMLIKAPVALLLGVLYAHNRGAGGQLRAKAWAQTFTASALFSALWLLAAQGLHASLGGTLFLPF